MRVLKSLTYREKKSTFEAYAIAIDSEEEKEASLKEIESLHPDARHILRCLRYPNRYGAMVSEASDDKEPIASMKKVRALMEQKDIKNKGVILVRYYGGTKLGASHLDHVYFTLAMKVLEND